MAVKIRRSKDVGCSCNSCRSNGGKRYDIGFGLNNGMQVIRLCDACMHSLLQKLIIVGGQKDGVR